MRDSGELEQLIEAVKRQPGSRAYAMLAERFLEAERVDEALRVCQAGFAANSTYERGALAYLRVLRKLGDTPTAEGVYQRAIGVHPRSSRLRVGWALVMLDEGREREARALAREALDLDPADREARALIATLGGTPPPSLAGSTREYQNPPLRKKDLQATSPPPLPASVRIRPPGQRTSATSLFDLSSAPPGADETPRPRFKRSPFDATPAPMHPVGDGPPTFEPQPAAAEHGPLSAAPREQPRPRRLDQTGEHDLFPEGGGSVTVTSVAEARITGEHAVATRPPSSAEGDIALSDTVSAPAVRKALVTTGPPAPPRPPAGLQGSGPRSALDFTLDSGARDMRDVTDLPLDASAPRTTEIDQLSPSMPVRRKKKRWPLVLLVLLLLLGGGGGTAGFFLYRRHAREQALLELTRLLDSTRVDRRTRYLSVEGKLAKLEAAPSARRAGARALVAAHLLRLGHRNEAQTAAWLRAGQGSHEAELARGLVAVHAALAKGSKAPLPSAPASNSWHGRLLAIEQAILARRWDAVEKLGRDELALGKKAAPAVLLAAAHEATDKKHASALIAAGLAVSPEHAGLRIERALVAEKPAGGAALVKLAGPVPEYKARALLVAAREAARGSDASAARAAAERAAQAPRAEAAALLLLARLQLGAGGDLVAAAGALERAIARQTRLDVDAQLRRVNVLLRLGRAYTARAALAGLSRDKLGAAATQHLALSVRAAALLDDWTTVDALCKRHGLAAAPRHACARAMIERPLLGRARALIGGVRDARAKATLLAELALARGDAKGAQRALARVKSAIPTDLAAIVAASSASLRGDKSRALALLRRELAVRAPDIDLRLALSRVLIGAGHDSEAREQLEHVIAAKPEAARVIAAVGVAMLGLGATDQAKRVLASAPEQARGSTALRLLAGRVALVEGDHTKARATLRGVLRDNPRDTDALIALARLAAEGKKRRLAGAYLARALKVRPDDPALQLSMARVYTALGRYRKALGPGLKAVRLFKQRNQDARSLDALINLGRMFGRSRDKWALARAEELLFEVCKDKSAPAVAFLELGLVHGRQRNRALAIVNLRKAVRRDPANARAVRALGLQLYSKRRSRRTAKKWLRKYLKLAPKAKDAKRIRALLKKR